MIHSYEETQVIKTRACETCRSNKSIFLNEPLQKKQRILRHEDKRNCKNVNSRELSSELLNVS